jgi:hypothetical protein
MPLSPDEQNEIQVKAILHHIRQNHQAYVKDYLADIDEPEKENFILLLLSYGINANEITLVPFLLDEKTGLITNKNEKDDLLSKALFSATMLNNSDMLSAILTLTDEALKSEYLPDYLQIAINFENRSVIAPLYEALSADKQITTLNSFFDEENSQDVFKALFALTPSSEQQRFAKEHISQMSSLDESTRALLKSALDEKTTAESKTLTL